MHALPLNMYPSQHENWEAFYFQFLIILLHFKLSFISPWRHFVSEKENLSRLHPVNYHGSLLCLKGFYQRNRFMPRFKMLLCRCDCSYFEDEPAIQSCYSRQKYLSISKTSHLLFVTHSVVTQPWKIPQLWQDTTASHSPSTATFWQSHRHIFPEDLVVRLSETRSCIRVHCMGVLAI